MYIEHDAVSSYVLQDLITPRNVLAVCSGLSVRLPATDGSSVWTPQGVEGMSKHLLGTLTAPRTTPAEAQDPIRYLLQLQADGAASLRGQNPVRLYLDTQVRYDSLAADAHTDRGDPARRHKTSLLSYSILTAMRMAIFVSVVRAFRCLIARLTAVASRHRRAQETNMFRLMDLVAEEHANKVWALNNAGTDLAAMQQLRAAAGSNGTSPRNVTFGDQTPTSNGAKPLAAGNGAVNPAADSVGGSGAGGLRPRDALAVRLVSKLTAIVVRHLPDLWHMPQERFAAMSGVSAAQQAATVQDATAALADLVQDFTEAYKCATLLLSSPSCANKPHQRLLQSLNRPCWTVGSLCVATRLPTGNVGLQGFSTGVIVIKYRQMSRDPITGHG